MPEEKTNFGESSGRQYASDFSSYGVEVTDKGQSPAPTDVKVDVECADRGPEK